jgi:hypothetical protein
MKVKLERRTQIVLQALPLKSAFHSRELHVGSSQAVSTSNSTFQS